MTKYSYACTANEYRPRMVLGNNARNSYACTSKRQRTSPTLTLFHSKEKIRTKCYSTAPRTSKPRCLYRPLLRSGTGMSENHLLITLLNIIKLSSPSLFNRDSTSQSTNFRSRRTQPIAITIQMCGRLHRER